MATRAKTFDTIESAVEFINSNGQISDPKIQPVEEYDRHYGTGEMYNFMLRYVLTYTEPEDVSTEKPTIKRGRIINEDGREVEDTALTELVTLNLRDAYKICNMLDRFRGKRI